MGVRGRTPALRAEPKRCILFSLVLSFLLCICNTKEKRKYKKNRKVKISYAAFLLPKRNAAQRNSPRRISVRYLLVIAHFLKFLTRTSCSNTKNFLTEISQTANTHFNTLGLFLIIVILKLQNIYIILHKHP